MQLQKSAIFCLISMTFNSVFGKNKIVLEDKWIPSSASEYFKKGVFTECLIIHPLDVYPVQNVPLPARCRAIGEKGTGPLNLFGRAGYTYHIQTKTCSYTGVGMAGRCPSFPDKWSCEMTCLGSSNVTRQCSA